MTPEGQIILDRVRQIRSNNNINWMEILRIALEAAPEQTKRALQQVIVNDEAVCREMRDLIR